MKRVTDRAGHDRRYAISPAKLGRTGWKVRSKFDESLAHTVEWYKANESWWRAIKDKKREFGAYYEKAYGKRLK